MFKQCFLMHLFTSFLLVPYWKEEFSDVQRDYVTCLVLTSWD